MTWGRHAPPLIIGHRGASAHALENTMAAFRRARADRADGVELDVLACRSGEVVVFHDDDLARLGGRPERIADLPLAELRAVRLGEGGESIPLLDEVLEELGSFMVNVEIKAPRAVAVATARLVPAVAAILARHPTCEALVSSFNPIALAQFRVLAPRVPTGLLFGVEQRAPLREAWARRVLRPAALHAEAALVDGLVVERWHREGFAVNVWTVDDEAEIARLAGIGVDGVITNDPARARRAIAS